MSDRRKGFRNYFLSAGGVGLVLLILVLINAVFAGVNLRWDATEEDVYSLSPGTLKILSELQENVTLKVFYSGSNPNLPVHLKTYARKLLDFLAEYEVRSRGRVTVETYDPVLDSEEEEWAEKYGIEGVDLPTGDRIYFGLVATAADQEETLPVIDPTGEQRLEYDITRMIHSIQSPRKMKIGLISSLPVFGGGSAMAFGGQQNQPPWLFLAELRKFYEVEQIAYAAQGLPEEVDLLMIVHPKHLNASLLYAIDQYVVSGGNCLIFMDGFAVMDALPGQDKASDLGPLPAAWGVAMEAGKVVTDFDYTTRLRTMDNRVENNPLWLSPAADAFNAEDIISGDLETMLLPAAGAIRKLAEGKATYEPLLQSSANSALTDGFKIRLGVSELRREFKPTAERYDLAVKLSGVFASAFPDGPPPGESGDSGAQETPAASPAPHRQQGRQPATLILVADADMLFDGHYVHKQNLLGFEIARIFNDNLNFLLNASEVLVGGQELISIRSRGKIERPFTRVQALEKKAQAKWLAREQELVRKADETNRKLNELERQKSADQEFILSDAQEAEIKQFQEEKHRINRELKNVRKNLRADIERLGNTVKLVNILLMPLLVSIAGLAYGLYRRQRSLGAGRPESSLYKEDRA